MSRLETSSFSLACASSATRARLARYPLLWIYLPIIASKGRSASITGAMPAITVASGVNGAVPDKVLEQVLPISVPECASWPARHGNKESRRNVGEALQWQAEIRDTQPQRAERRRGA